MQHGSKKKKKLTSEHVTPLLGETRTRRQGELDAWEREKGRKEGSYGRKWWTKKGTKEGSDGGRK